MYSNYTKASDANTRLSDLYAFVSPVIKDGKEASLRDAEERLAGHFNVTPSERAELLPSGQQGIF